MAEGREDGVLRDAAHCLVFIKLGGSLVSDKTKPEALRKDVLCRIARYQYTRQQYQYVVRMSKYE